MRKRILVFVFAAALLMALAVPLFGGSGTVYADNRGPCNDSGLPGNSDYAAHHIKFLATNGDIGQVEHDGDSIAHQPGSHQGFSFCDPSG